MSNMSIPEEFICPITQMLMRDPYVDKDGNSYEKDAITDWLRRKPMSPITRNPMTLRDVFPNRTLKSLIESFRTANPELCEAEDKAQQAESKEERLHPSEALSQLGRKPIILFAVIDVSGSMQSPCDSKERHDGSREGDGYSRLDLVKHTLNTIISSLTKYDKICIIQFSTTASIYIKLTSVLDERKAGLMARVNDLEAEGQTNIWDGMRVAVDEIADLQNTLQYDEKHSEAKRSSVEDLNVQIYLLTDGEPTINPPAPLDTTVKNYIARKCSSVSPTVSTFGYGYQLDSQLLYTLATPSLGTFGFIPDASMVGTVFINALTNSLFMRSHRSNLTRHFLDSFDYMLPFYSTLLSSMQQLIAPRISYADRQEALEELLSNTNATLDLHLQRADISEESRFVRQFLEGLVKDIAPTADDSLGQLNKAIQPEYVNKWGVHYLRSVLSAFQSRQCVNFKDQAMQVFQQCDALLVRERERIEEIFLQLPAPQPSIVFDQSYDRYRYSNTSTTAAPQQPAAPQNMARYYNVSGGCFTADTLLYSASHSLRAVIDMKVGDKIWSQQGEATIEAIVSMPYEGPLYTIGASSLTAYHPVLIEGRDFFPVDLSDRGLYNVQAKQFRGRVYDFILSNRSLMKTSLPGGNGECEVYIASMGHNVVEYSKFRHAFFGSEKVVSDLKKHFVGKVGEKEIWEMTAQDQWQRSEEGLVTGILFA